MYRELRDGRGYAADVKVGLIERARLNRDGVEHPYLLVVPKSYTGWPRHGLVATANRAD